MRSSSLPLLLGCALVLATPLAASAQDYTPSVKPIPFVPLNANDPGVVTHTWTGNSIPGLNLPFPVVYYGQVFNQINISTYGYVSFSSRPGVDELPGGYADPNVSANQHPLPNATKPNGVIAAWWDNLVCPAGSIKTADQVIDGSRTFTVEWNGCYKSGTTSSTVAMQIRFTELSYILKVFYGVLGAGGTFDATAGIEDPVKWEQDPNTGAWILITPGGTRGHNAPLAAGAVCPTAGCGRPEWPTNQMVQYGRPNAADLQAGLNDLTGRIGVNIASMTGVGTITFTIENAIENGGRATATGFGWDYYVSTTNVLDTATATKLNCSHTTPETIAGLTTTTFTDTCTATLSPGGYYLCTYVDPPPPPGGVVTEANESNNAYCSQQFVVGADISGQILSLAAAGEAGQDMPVEIRIENRGSDPTGQFWYQLFWRDCTAIDGQGDVLAHEAQISLGGAGVFEAIGANALQVPIRPDAEGNSICAVLKIDPANAVPELDETNNTWSTCQQNGDIAKICANISRPELRVNDITVDLPHGCFYGDLISLNAEICNEGATEARSFGLAFYLDVNSIATLSDTMIISMPQACDNTAPGGGHGMCQDLGGGQPQCVNGTCHAPCLVDADCGNGGLECEPDYVLPGTKSCQLVLPGQSCKTIRVTSNLPEFDTRANMAFADSYIFFSTIVDWTDDVGEIYEGNENKKTTAAKYFCWTRKPDFEPVDLRTMPAIASGEVVPVYRRVRNHGVVGHAFSYRYVLTSNTTASIHDLALEIVDVGPVGDDTVADFSDSVKTDMVRLPAGVVPGTYYIGIVVDPDDQVLELSETNNVAITAEVEVVDSSLRILTPSLRDATVGASYNVQLLATGGDGRFAWSVSGGELPPGMRLEPNGLFHGSPLEQGTYLFKFQVASAGNVAESVFAMDVVPARGPLAIDTLTIPDAYKAVEYRVLLGASGGNPPYAWACQNLPGWLRLTNNLLSGISLVQADPVAFTCTVTDDNGSSVSRGYTIQVFPADELRIVSDSLDQGRIGSDWLACATADGGSGSYTWTIDLETAPGGVVYEEVAERGCLRGKLTSCGSFLVSVSVTDDVRGLTDTKRLPASILCNPISLTTRNAPPATRSADPETPPYELQLETNADGVKFEIALGELPQGLELSEGGLISGRVAVDATPGAYDIAVRMSNDAGGTGLGALTINVLPDPPPDVTITNTEKISGCSTSGEGSAAGLLPFAALFALLGLRRTSVRRSAAVAGLVAAAVLLPTVASAQTIPGYAQYKKAQPYTRLEGATPVPITDLQDGYATMDLPFDFPFFGETYTRLYASVEGPLWFSTASTSYNAYKIPYTSTPNNFIAAWWEYSYDMMVEQASDFRYQVRGQAPNREIVFEWIWGTHYSSSCNTQSNWTHGRKPGGEHQVSIFEDGTIKMRWGDIAGSSYSTYCIRGVAGMEDATASAKSVAIGSCSMNTGSPSSSQTVTCDVNFWETELKDTERIFTVLPNLQIRSASTHFEGLAGLEQTFSATVYNHGPYSATAPVKFFASLDDVLDESDVAIGTTGSVTVPAFGEATVELTTALPRSLQAARYYLLAQADPENILREFYEDDNAGGANRFRVMPASPDLSVDWVGVPASGTPGSTITVDLTVSNLGNALAEDVPFRIVLSQNEVITAADVGLYEGTFTVDWLETVDVSEAVTIPADTPAGAYHIGVVVDPDNGFVELDKLNNVKGSDRAFHVVTGGLRIVTRFPEEVEVGSEFCIGLEADGGDGVYTWSLVEGALPPGVTLFPGGEAGDASLCGRPSALGIYDFTLEVTSGGMGARTQVAIDVVKGVLALGISSRELPMARFQYAYEAGLIAFGGKAPYTWEIVGGQLPAGLTFHGDGLIFGAPMEAGSFGLQVKVTDAAAKTATGDVSLLVSPPARITCSTHSLGLLPVGEEFQGKLLSGGGTGPYEWNTVSTKRYGDSSGVAFDPTRAPQGLSLGVSDGAVSGAPTQVGRYLWTVKVKATGSNEEDTCAVELEVVAGQGLTVTTSSLPNAVPDRDYYVKLQAAGGTGTLTWTLMDGSFLPNNLKLSTQGVLSGKLTAADLQDAEKRVFSFLVEVRDAQNNRGTGALSVTLAPAPEGKITVKDVKIEEGGCQSAAGGLSLAALALVLVALRRRR